MYKLSHPKLLVIAVLILLNAPNTIAQKNLTKPEFINDTTSSFEKLTSRFKGRVVFVDFWASWCVPCRRELEKKRDIKAFADFAQKHNIVILYISDDRNEKDWESYLSKNLLIGYHVLTGSYLKSEIRSRFGVPKSIRHPEFGTAFFIPRHMIVDKDGKVIDNNAGRQGNVKVYNQLKSLSAAD